MQARAIAPLPWLRFGFVGAVVVTALILGPAVSEAPNIVIAAAILVPLVGFTGTRWVAGVGLWSIWMITPFLRRLVVYFVASPGAYDPLSLLPFVATLICGFVAFSRLSNDATARRLLWLASTGFLLGFPVGMLRSPTAAFYGSLAYSAGLAGLLIGHAEATERSGQSTLTAAMKWIPPVLAIYGIYQYVIGLPRWDENWAETSGLGSLKIIGQLDHYRPWATLNSPGTFSVVIVISLLAWIGAKRVGVAHALVIALLVGALAMTYVRAAWLGLVIGLIAIGLSNRRSSTRVVFAVLFTAVLVFTIGSRVPLVQSVVGRASSFGNLQNDKSAQARLALLRDVLPGAIIHPLGHGVGQAGVASRLGGTQDLASADNGFVAILYQFGPAGFALITGVQIYILVVSSRLARTGNLQRTGIPSAFGLLVALFLMGLFGDVLYGISGVVFWWVGGYVLAVADQLRVVAKEGSSPMPVIGSNGADNSRTRSSDSAVSVRDRTPALRHWRSRLGPKP